MEDGDDGGWRDKARGLSEGGAQREGEGGRAVVEEKEEVVRGRKRKRKGKETKEDEWRQQVGGSGGGRGCGTVDRCVARVSSGSRALAP